MGSMVSFVSARVVPTRVGSLTAATQIHNPSAPRWKEIDQQGMRESDAGGTHACRMECEIVMIFPKKDLWIHRWLKAIVACLILGILVSHISGILSSFIVGIIVRLIVGILAPCKLIVGILALVYLGNPW